MAKSSLKNKEHGKSPRGLSHVNSEKEERERGGRSTGELLRLLEKRGLDPNRTLDRFGGRKSLKRDF